MDGNKHLLTRVDPSEVVEGSTVLPTPVIPSVLQQVLAESTVSRAKSDYLVDGFRNGFALGVAEDMVAPPVPMNLRSAVEQPEVLESKLTEELRRGRVAGPFPSKPFANMVVSPLGIVPKKCPGKFRRIHHLSFPAGLSVNDQIPQERKTVKYDRVDEAVACIRRFGSGCWLSKTDIASAYRIIPVRPLDYRYLGMVWDGAYYYDRCLPMGCASACAIFQRFSDALQQAALDLGVSGQMCHVLDDFLFINGTAGACGADLSVFLRMCESIGVPIAEEKTEGPLQEMVFLGITLDTVSGEMRLPLDKVADCITTIELCLHRSRLTLKELQSLIGKLSFACCVCVPGRAFLRRLIDLTIGVKRAWHKVRLSVGCKADLSMWVEFLSGFNGRSMFIDEHWTLAPDLRLYTDAAGSIGFGLILGSHWALGRWPAVWMSRGITFKEMYPILVTLHLWGESLRNKRIVCHTDNMAVVSAVNHSTCRCPHTMCVVRALVGLCLRHNVVLRAEHIPGINNGIADALSRFQVDRFRQLVAAQGWDIAPTPTHIGRLPLL